MLGNFSESCGETSEGKLMHLLLKMKQGNTSHGCFLSSLAVEKDCYRLGPGILCYVGSRTIAKDMGLSFTCLALAEEVRKQFKINARIKRHAETGDFCKAVLLGINICSNNWRKIIAFS